MKLKILTLTLCACIGLISGCAAKRANQTNPAPITQGESLNYDNAQISIHNRAIAKSLVLIHQQGFVNDEYFGKLSSAQIRITKLHKDLTPLLKSNASALASKDKVTAILNEIKAVASQMVADGSVGIVNPDSKNAVLTDISALISSATSIYSIIESLRASAVPWCGTAIGMDSHSTAVLTDAGSIPVCVTISEVR